MNFKNIALATTLLTTVFLTACVAPQNNKINLAPRITLPNQDLTINATSINVVSVDNRSTATLAKLERKGELIELMPNRDVRFLLQEIVEKQMAARGFSVGGNAPVTVQIILNRLDANVTEGNLKHRIDAVVELTLQTRSVNNSLQHSKTYRGQYSLEGALTASQAKIEEVLNTVLTNAINEMAQDNSVATFIRQN
ncbi:YajG family lipoprotein [Thorsellia kenyensis]|uniref:YajG family lipoprotein n=1 Tax=Thorsellia kenyensis TaxID=1549888 RepID=A0ABV6C9R2_9GAMM